MKAMANQYSIRKQDRAEPLAAMGVDHSLPPSLKN